MLNTAPDVNQLLKVLVTKALFELDYEFYKKH